MSGGGHYGPCFCGCGRDAALPVLPFASKACATQYALRSTRSIRWCGACREWRDPETHVHMGEEGPVE